MSDPADKSDDLIAELAKLMAATPGKDSTVQPIAKPAPILPQQTAATPTVRIPGMDGPARSASPGPSASSPEPRSPATGTIRIPGMDQPAPVSTSAPVGKFDFGKPVAAAPIRQEPLSTLSERLAAQDPIPPRQDPPSPASSVRIPSGLTPVSENRSFGDGPSLAVARPGVAATPAGGPVSPAAAPAAGSAASTDFTFDFGFAQNPPASGAPKGQPPSPVASSPDPIAALIEADLAKTPAADDQGDARDPTAGEPAVETAKPTAVVTPMIRPVNGMAQPQPKPSIAPAASVSPRPSSQPIPLKPVSVPPRSAESDRFAISPGVGLNVRPQPNQALNGPSAGSDVGEGSDPMSEIESLIGEAVRVELSPGPVRVQAAQPVAPKVELEPEEDIEREIAQHQPEPSPSPVVPPLTTQFAPRRANLKDDKSTRSAEEAILAAAAASGSEVGRLEPSVGDESPYRRLKVRPQRSSFMSGGMRQYIGMAVAGTLLLAAGLGLYWVLNMGRGANTGANAPQLTADATPVKAKPSEAPKPASDTAKSPVLAKMDGASTAPSAEQLVSTEASAADVTRDVTPAPADEGEGGLANRKVRTVTVRPDGTIVSGDDAVAGAEALPIERPNVPSVPSAESTNLLGNGQTPATDPLVPDATTTAADSTSQGASAEAATQVAEAEQPVIDPSQVAPVPMPFPVRAASGGSAAGPTNSAVNALVGAETPNGQIDLLGGNGSPSPAAAPQRSVAAPAPATSSGGAAAAYVQLSSQPSAADAAASVKTMTARYGSLFGGNKLVVQQVDLGQKGIRWRVRLPAASLSDAASICAQIKAQGGDCFATSS